MYVTYIFFKFQELYGYLDVCNIFHHNIDRPFCNADNMDQNTRGYILDPRMDGRCLCTLV